MRKSWCDRREMQNEGSYLAVVSSDVVERERKPVEGVKRKRNGCFACGRCGVVEYTNTTPNRGYLFQDKGGGICGMCQVTRSRVGEEKGSITGRS